MIGFFVLMLLMGASIWLTSYWISWEIEDARTRPTFRAQLNGDWTRLFGRNRVATSRERSAVVAQSRAVPTPRG